MGPGAAGWHPLCAVFWPLLPVRSALSTYHRIISSLLGALIVVLRKRVDVELDLVRWKFCISGGKALKRSFGFTLGSFNLPVSTMGSNRQHFGVNRHAVKCETRAGGRKVRKVLHQRHTN